ncbi:MAG: hypothetical protein K8S55_12890 [Phycisphaerae bacterium]|nr:hypothetical protein [Phycisphaerae bacterium]
MIARVHSSILQGIDAVACEVETDVSKGGMGEVKLVGLADAAEMGQGDDGGKDFCLDRNNDYLIVF